MSSSKWWFAEFDNDDRMTRNTLLDFFDERVRTASEFFVYDDGLRTRTYTYDDVRRAAIGFAHRLQTAGIEPGQNVVVWGENRPEWIAVFWGCLLARAVVVPIDYRASRHFLARVVALVSARFVVIGDDVPRIDLPEGVHVWSLGDLGAAPRPSETWPQPAQPERLPESAAAARADDLAEIIFTSGATAEPKGVQITHGNVLANIVPVEREVLKYQKYGRPFAPLRFLTLLPLSHMFGQAMATFIPPMLAGVSVFMRSYNPADIVRQIHTRRVSVLVCVPKILDVLREHILRVAPEAAEAPAAKPHIAVRWWRYRRIHRLFGFKFWAFVVGAAPLDPELEEFWSRLGFLVVQGYGLTETAPIVTLNHPFRARKGTVGTPISGVEVRIAEDGEILVRGANVTSGYYKAPDETAAAFEGGWFHTGDIGALDAAGRLTVRGRKKDVIVTPEGLNVFPDDVERVIREVSGVRDAAVVGVTHDGQERVHAVVILDPGVETASVLRDANARLEDHQRIRGCSVWPDAALPRTEGTQKLKRRELRRWVAQGAQPLLQGTTAAVDGVEAVVQGFVPDRSVEATTTLEELGLSSIERIELMMALESAFDRSVDELAFAKARTVGDLRPLVAAESVPRGPAVSVAAAADVHDFPSWNRRGAARLARWIALPTFLLPLTRLFAWIRVEGLDQLARTTDPVVYAANHQSFIDGAVILAALPSPRRYRVATAAAKEFFAAHFHPDRHSRREWVTNSLNYYLSSLFFNVFPLPQREAGTREAIRYLGELLSEGTSVLIFPEGRRTQTGAIDTFQPGIGMIAARLQVPIVPVRIEGVDRILHYGWHMARPGRARVAFGAPLRLEGDNYRVLATQVEDAVRAL